MSKANFSIPITRSTSSRTLYRSWRLFYWKKPSLTHAVVPPFRNRSRSSRLFGCKRPHNGFVSLPPCFGLLLVFQIHFCICCFLFSFSAGFEPIVHLLRSKRDIKIVASDKACLVGFCHPSQKKALAIASAFFSSIRLTASSIATQWYTAFSRVILPYGSWRGE